MDFRLFLQMTSLLLEAVLALLAGAFLIRPIRMLIFGRLDAPSVPTPRSALPHIVEVLELRAGDVVYDLGSGYGGIVLQCAKLAPSAYFVGIERSLFLYFVSRTRTILRGSPANVSFLRQDIFQTDLSPATKIYAYLVPSLMNALLRKIEEEARGARMVSYAFQFKDRTPLRTVFLSQSKNRRESTRLYIYEF